MSDNVVEIRTLDTAEEMATVGRLLQQVWGSPTPLVEIDLLQAISHSGGYVSGAYDHGNLIGASFGFLGRYGADLCLHSHVTGILPGVQHAGLGKAIKEHQREWAAGNDIPWITWTFDPLVRTNAWFNVERLGVRVARYLVNFYGPMGDSINVGDETDRLLVAWASDPGVGRPVAPTGARVVEVATPEDIVLLRRTQSPDALEWRERVRDELEPLVNSGGTVVGFTRDGAYQVAVAD